uniref:Uncharacterized protein n=1 Tax=Meloidogyne enterolobii TaxID=390850 RepID=A0A6V7Y546_MELEN|nr:unnamed protein product [Meloidogyne enterolobii]
MGRSPEPEPRFLNPGARSRSRSQEFERPEPGAGANKWQIPSTGYLEFYASSFARDGTITLMMHS